MPIDATSCMYDSVLLRHADDDWTWWLDLHHVATDAWSSALIFEATATAYEHDDPVSEAGIDLGSVIDGSFFEYAARPRRSEAVRAPQSGQPPGKRRPKPAGHSPH